MLHYNRNILLSIFLLAWFACPFKIFSQQDPNTIKVKKPVTISKLHVITATGSYIIYKGLKNSVGLKVDGVQDASLKIKTSKNLTFEGKNGSYMISAGDGKRAVIYVYQRIGSGSVDKTKLIDSAVFQVLPIPDPKIIVAGRTGNDTISKSVLLSNDSLLAVWPFKSGPPCYYIIQQFDISAMVNGIFIVQTVTGNKLNDFAKNIIRKASPGKNIYFDNINVKDPSGTIRKMACSFKLK